MSKKSWYKFYFDDWLSTLKISEYTGKILVICISQIYPRNIFDQEISATIKAVVHRSYDCTEVYVSKGLND